VLDNRAGAELLRRDPGGADPLIAKVAGACGDHLVEFCGCESISDDPLVRPVFLVSSPRAGSTMVFDALSRSHHLWSLGMESHDVIEGIPKLNARSCEFDSHALAKEDADAATVRILRCAFLAHLRDARGHAYLELARHERPARLRMLEKTPENALRVRFLRAAFPDAQFVYVLRDPRQNISSMITAWRHDGFISIPALPGWDQGDWHLLLPHGWRRLRGRTLAEITTFQWASANEAISAALLDGPPENWIAVEYDDLVTQPDAALRRICEFLDIPAEDGLIPNSGRGLALAETTLAPPSPTKWRYNHDFDERAVQLAEPLIRRLNEIRRDAVTTVAPALHRTPARFRCFLEELDAEPTTGVSLSDEDEQTLIVHPSFEFQLGVTIPLRLVRRARFRERFVEDVPIAWVEDDQTTALQPFWIRPEHIWLFRALRAGEPPSPPSSARLRKLLVNARILVTEADLISRRQEGEAHANEAAKRFTTENYCELSGLLHAAHVRALARYYRELIAEGSWELGDAQVAGRYGWQNELLGRFFHHQLTAYVGRVVGERVKPSYAYVAAYREGAVLERHVDREQCEFTVSLLIDEDPADGCSAWPLYFDTPTGTTSVEQAVGDAVLFRGPALPHYRDRLGEGRRSTSLLFHYVPATFRGTLY
jgi:Sulfotransferase family